jgi:hypothetical protein
MNRWLAVGLVLIASAHVVRADDASKKAKVEELITVMHMDRLTEQVLASIKNNVEAMSKANPGGQPLTADQQKALSEFEDKSLKLVGDAMSWDSMKGEFVNLYVQTFSEEEIDGMVAFYKTPAGQAVLTKMPQLTNASMKLAQQRIQALQPQLQVLQDQLMAKMEAGSGVSTPAAPPATSTKPQPAVKKN